MHVQDQIDSVHRRAALARIQPAPRGRSMRIEFTSVVVAAALAAAAAAEVKVYKSDSLPDQGGTIACQAGFASNKIDASVFTVAAADGPILVLEAQVYACDGSGLGLAQARPMQVLVYGAGVRIPALRSSSRRTSTARRVS
jgi:hypothetical protein